MVVDRVRRMCERGAAGGMLIAGPLLAGTIIAASGPRYVFALNAVLSLVAILLLANWPQVPIVRRMPGERFFGAIRVGLQHVRQSKGSSARWSAAPRTSCTRSR